MDKILMAMSGGVDSTVAAMRLIEQGYEVEGLYMSLWGGKSRGSSCSTADHTAATAAATYLGIPLHTVDWTAEFDAQVAQTFIKGLRRGDMLNPCVACNRVFKIQGLVHWADQYNYDRVATGHYARIESHDGRPYLCRALDLHKDQSYFMHTIPGALLDRFIFPLGDLSKTEVRRIAANAAVPAANTADSMDLCFSPKDLLDAHGGGHSGDIVDTGGAVIGHVQDVELVAIGQRRGLGVSGRDKLYVVDVDPDHGRVVMGETKDLMVLETKVRGASWIWDIPSNTALVQTSAHGNAVAADCYMDDDTLTLSWSEPVRRPAPGQEAVLYNADRVIGGGTIC